MSCHPRLHLTCTAGQKVFCNTVNLCTGFLLKPLRQRVFMLETASVSATVCYDSHFYILPFEDCQHGRAFKNQIFWWVCFYHLKKDFKKMYLSFFSEQIIFILYFYLYLFNSLQTGQTMCTATGIISSIMSLLIL